MDGAGVSRITRFLIRDTGQSEMYTRQLRQIRVQQMAMRQNGVDDGRERRRASVVYIPITGT